MNVKQKRAKIACFVSLMACLLIFTEHAQAQDKTLDSLQKLLSSKTKSVDQIPLRYQIGVQKGIGRFEYWDSLLAESRKYKLSLYESKVLIRLSLLYEAIKKDNAKALEFAHASIAIAEREGYKKDMAYEIRQLLEYYRKQDDKLFLDWSYKGLRLAEEVGDKKLSVDFYSRIATHFFFSGNTEKALTMHFNCLRLYRQYHDTLNIAGTLTDIGSDYRKLGDKKKACYYYLESGKYAQALGNNFYGAYIYNSVSSAYLMMNNADSALKYSHKAYEIFSSLNDEPGMASALLDEGGAYMSRQDYEEAEKKLLKALEISQRISFVTQIPDIAIALKNLNMRKKNYKAAIEAYELYVRIKDSISSESEKKRSLEKEFEYSFEKKENENKLLAQQNQIQLLQLNQTRYGLLGLGVILFLIIASGFIFFKQNRLRSEQQSLILEQKLLRSHMNPHFIFNSLNSIQQFIMSHQNEKAETYLSKFARLVRNILESNIKESISIKEEAEILVDYLEMESLRFGGSFSYSVNINNNVAQNEACISHMMIQPFVENAIWHGLLPKKNEKKVTITFEAGSNNTVHCIIDDNGIGRTESIKNRSTFGKNSLAMNFIKQRIVLMRKTLKVDCRVDIIDKTDAGGESAGTKVIVILPILNKS